MKNVNRELGCFGGKSGQNPGHPSLALRLLSPSIRLKQPYMRNINLTHIRGKCVVIIYYDIFPVGEFEIVNTLKSGFVANMNLIILSFRVFILWHIFKYLLAPFRYSTTPSNISPSRAVGIYRVCSGGSPWWLVVAVVGGRACFTGVGGQNNRGGNGGGAFLTL